MSRPQGNGRTRSGRIVNAMTVDVEDYFHVAAFEGRVERADWSLHESRVRRNTERLLDTFARHRARATFFFLGWVAEREPALVRQVAAAGHDLALHSHWHRLVYDLTPEEFRRDVREGRAAVEAAAGTRVVGYRAPTYSVTERSLWALDVLIEEGFEYDASIFPIHHDRYGIPSAPRHAHRLERPSGRLTEIPASTVRLGPVNLPVAGGGYFRLLPYAWTAWGLRQINTVERRPAVFYIHPWEIDPHQPRLPAPFLTRVRHYTGLSQTGERLDRLLRDFTFDSIESVFMRETAPLRG